MSLTPDEFVTRVEMLLGWELDEWQRTWVRYLYDSDFTPERARLAIVRPPR